MFGMKILMVAALLACAHAALLRQQTGTSTMSAQEAALAVQEQEQVARSKSLAARESALQKKAEIVVAEQFRQQAEAANLDKRAKALAEKEKQVKTFEGEVVREQKKLWTVLRSKTAPDAAAEVALETQQNLQIHDGFATQVEQDEEVVKQVKANRDMQASLMQVSTRTAPDAATEVALETQQNLQIHDGFATQAEEDEKVVKQVKANRDLQASLLQVKTAPDAAAEVALETAQNLQIHDGFATQAEEDDKVVKQVRANRDLQALQTAKSPRRAHLALAQTSSSMKLKRGHSSKVKVAGRTQSVASVATGRSDLHIVMAAQVPSSGWNATSDVTDDSSDADDEDNKDEKEEVKNKGATDDNDDLEALK